MNNPALSSPLLFTFNGFDLILLAFCVLSASVGFVRGVTREILSISGWVGAFLGMVYLLPFVRPWARSFISNTMLADILAGGCIFICLLAFFLVLSQTISSHVKHSVLGGLDRSLGFLFGILRGGFLICLVYMGLLFFWPYEKHPDFLRTAKSIPWIQEGATKLKKLVPQELIDASKSLSSMESSVEQMLPQKQIIEKTVEALSTLRPDSNMSDSAKRQPQQNPQVIKPEPHSPLPDKP